MAVDVMSLFWSSKKNYQVEHYFPQIFSASDKMLKYSPRPTLPTFSLMFITPLNFKCRTSIIIIIQYYYYYYYYYYHYYYYQVTDIHLRE